MGQPRPLFRLISVIFKQTVQFLQQIYVKKCPFSIRCRDLNPRPTERESLPITTRPGLPQSKSKLPFNLAAFTWIFHSGPDQHLRLERSWQRGVNVLLHLGRSWDWRLADNWKENELQIDTLIWHKISL